MRELLSVKKRDSPPRHRLRGILQLKLKLMTPGASARRARACAARTATVRMEPDEPLPTLSSLPDALLQHALSYLSSDLTALGRMLCTSAALSATGHDDAVFRPLCRSRFGLEGLYDPERAPCASYWHAARAWTQLCAQQGEAELWRSMRVVAHITEGARVTLVGLSRVELNGRRGRALRPLPQVAGRWEVEIEVEDADGGIVVGGAPLSVRTDNLRLCDMPLVPLLAPLWTRAAAAWHVLAAWAEATLPELHATLAPPADSQAWANTDPDPDPKPDPNPNLNLNPNPNPNSNPNPNPKQAWATFLREVELPQDAPCLAPLRALWSQHDGQRIEIDIKIAVENEVPPSLHPALHPPTMHPPLSAPPPHSLRTTLAGARRAGPVAVAGHGGPPALPRAGGWLQRVQQQRERAAAAAAAGGGVDQLPPRQAARDTNYQLSSEIRARH